MWCYTSSYSTHVTIEGSSCHNHLGCQAQTFSPFGCQMTDGFISRFGFRKQAVSKAGQKRIQRHQELFGRQSAPFRMPHGLMPARTPAANNLIRRGNARQQCRQPFAMFYDGISRLPDSLIFTQDMQGLCPIPLRRINSSFVSRIVDRPFLAKLIDFSSFFYRCMIFPQDKHCIGILGKLRQ